MKLILTDLNYLAVKRITGSVLSCVNWGEIRIPPQFIFLGVKYEH